MKSLLAIHTNPVLVQIAGGKTEPMAEIIFTFSEKIYSRAPESAAPEAPQVQATEQFTTVRFMANASECSRTAALFHEQGEQLQELGETQGDAIALRGENKVLRDILAEAQIYIEEGEHQGAESTRLLEIIKAARTGRA